MTTESTTPDLTDTVTADELHAGSWVNDDQYAPHPVVVDYVSAPYHVTDPMEILTGTTSVTPGIRMVTVLFKHHDLPSAFAIPADRPVTVATPEEVSTQVESERRVRIAATLRRLSEIVLDSRVPVDSMGVQVHMGSTDRTTLHHVAGIIGEEVVADYIKRDGETVHQVAIGDYATGIKVQWDAAWKVEQPPADPCADGCSDPAAHAEGAHDL